MRHLLAAVITFAALSSRANVYITPVVSAKVNGRVYTTTTVLRNSGQDTVKCESVYAIPNDPRGGTLRATFTVEAGVVLVQESTLAEADAIGTVRLECSDALLVVVRIQASTDGGKTFDAGRMFRSVGEDQAITPKTSRSFRAQSDLLMMEVNGRDARARVVVKDLKGHVVGDKSCEISAFAEQIVNLAEVREKAISAAVEITVSGEGAVVVTPQSQDASIAALFNPAAPVPRVTSVSTLSSEAVQVLAMSAFKAAPFVEPMTGLIYMRDRWYDPHTGSFISPDPEGYADSANLFSYCHGDPVNCSDPTGHMDGGDVREDFRQKENAERARRAAAWCKANPVECKKLEVRGNGILRMVGGVGQTAAGAGAFASTGPLPEPITKTLGGIAIARGIDNTITGAVETWTGEQRSTMTGRALYLTLVRKGVDRATASRITGWTEVGVDVVSTVGSSFVPGVNAALRVRPINGVINIGGTGEAAATNLNPLIGETGGQTRSVPNLVNDYADQIGRQFEPGSARSIISNRLPAYNVNWPVFARGAHATLQSGGIVNLNLYITGSIAEQGAVRAAALRAFQEAGFTNVYLEGENVGTFLHATR